MIDSFVRIEYGTPLTCAVVESVCTYVMYLRKLTRSFVDLPILN